MERDFSPFMSDKSGKISIHSLAWRETYNNVDDMQYVAISIHSLAWRETRAMFT